MAPTKLEDFKDFQKTSHYDAMDEMVSVDKSGQERCDWVLVSYKGRVHVVTDKYTPEREAALKAINEVI
jgi:hypothetical protein